MTTHNALIAPDWPAPHWIKAYSTTRLGGVSLPPFASFNLATHVDDHPEHVQQNRQRLIDYAALPQAPHWLNQVHGTRVVDAHNAYNNIEADASYTHQADTVCAVMTADCLPVLFCDDKGTQVAAAHAGWRGLLNGVLEQTIARFDCSPAHIMAWLGPAIGPQKFEVGTDVYQAFCHHSADAAIAFKQTDPHHYLADIFMLARLRLAHAGVSTINGGGICTASDPQRFFSYRRDGKTGRMASIIWIAKK